MADNEDRNEKTSRGNEWEVVSLTASTYAAAPGPDEVELKDDDKVDLHLQGEAETSSALFMSGHFVFPPSKHENLPLEPEYNEVYDESGGGDVAFEVTSEDGNIPSRKDEKNFSFAGSNVPEEFDGIQYFDDKANKLYVHEKFDEGTTLPGFSLTEKEETMYDSAKYTSFHSETAIGVVTAYGESIDESETLELAEQGANVCPDLSESKSTSKYDNYSPSHLPCEAWWKRRAASFYAHAKEANAFWSVFVAATLMGLVMLGQRWQQERALKLKWQISVNDEVRSRVLAPLFRLKDVIVRGHRHGPLIRGSSTVEG